MPAFSSKKYLFIGIIFLFSVFPANAIEMAITIDDLPAPIVAPQDRITIDVAEQMLAVFKKHHIKNVYGFMNGFAIRLVPDGQKTLEKWVLDGQLLGNHTFTHVNLSEVNIWQYQDDIELNEYFLSAFMFNQDYKYFRYPYSSEGNNKQIHDIVYNFLAKENYKIAYITLNFYDYLWNKAYMRCRNKDDKSSIAWMKNIFLTVGVDTLVASQQASQRAFNREIKFILLLHFTQFDAIMLDQLLTAYEKMGVKFISLPEALSDDVYQNPTSPIKKIFPGHNALFKFSLLRILQNKYVYLLPASTNNKPSPMDIYRQEISNYHNFPMQELNSICR